MPLPEQPTFSSAETAWFWAVRALHSHGPGSVPQSVHDIVRCLDTLYRHRRIDLIHARILRIWGLRGVAPSPERARERSDWRIWREAIDRLEAPLRARGLVDGPSLQGAAD